MVCSQRKAVIITDMKSQPQLAVLTCRSLLLEICSFLGGRRGAEWCPEHGDLAARNGNLSLMQDRLLRGKPFHFSTAAMDEAAARNDLRTVGWLSAHSRAGCTVAAVNTAAVRGHYQMVALLTALGAPASQWAMDVSNLLSVIFICILFDIIAQHIILCIRCEQESVAVCSTDGRYRGFLENAELLPVRMYTPLAVVHNMHSDFVVCSSHTQHQSLSLHFYCLLDTLSPTQQGAAAQGDLPMLQLLGSLRSEGCTSRAHNSAAVRGRLDILTWLGDNCASSSSEPTDWSLTGQYFHVFV
jgi:hypothetical protein